MKPKTRQRKAPPQGPWTDQEVRQKTADGFGYDQYVDVLTDRILKTETPSTIGILGSWGSGKSSLMRLIEESINGPAPPPPQTKPTLKLWISKSYEGLKTSADELNEKIKECFHRSHEWFRTWVMGWPEGDSKVEQPIQVKTIWINVWELSTQEEVWHAFLQAIFSGVYIGIPWRLRIDWRKLGDKAVRSSWRVLVVAIPALAAVYLNKEKIGNWNDVRNLLNLESGGTWAIVVGVATQIVALFTIYKPAWDAIRKSLKFDVSSVLKLGSYEAQISELVKLRKRFGDVVNLAVGDEGRIVVFIDDLDRCTPDKVPEILEAIKLFASTQSCVYVLAFDPKVVAECIARKYGFAADTEGINYLEKIVQIPFQLPPLDQTDIQKFINKEYPELHWSTPSTFAKGLVSNPRTIKRAINTYRLVQAMVEKRVAAWEIDPLDPELVAKWVVIQTGFKGLYAHLVEKPNDLLAVEQWAKAGPGEKQFDFRSGSETIVAERDQPALKSILSEGSEFQSPLEAGRIRWYISLGGEAASTDSRQRPDTKYRAKLLSNDKKAVEDAVKEIVPEFYYEDGKLSSWGVPIRNAYRDRLREILSDVERYKERGERLSANYAIELLENRTREPNIPITVCVPGERYRMGGWNWDERPTQEAKDTGVDLKLMNAKRVTVAAYPPDFRIGMYPVKNSEFEEFLKRITNEKINLASDPRFRPDIVECEAYWKPCVPKVPHEWNSNTVPSTNHSLVSFNTGLDQTPDTQTLPFLRDDGSPVCEVKVEYVRAYSRTLRFEFTWILPADKRDHYEFELDPYPGLSSVKQVFKKAPAEDAPAEDAPAEDAPAKEAPAKDPRALTFHAPGSKLGIETDDFLVRIRLMGEGSEIVKPQGLLSDRPFDVEISVWDRATIPRPKLSRSYAEWLKEEHEADHPVTGVTWQDAVAYCMWLRSVTNVPYRLPTELEWELAAMGQTDSTPRFPWGADWDPKLANTLESGVGNTTPVNEYSGGKSSGGESSGGDSPYCCVDMAGNVWEWCADPHNDTFDIEFTGDTWQDVRIHGDPKPEHKNERIVRGGSWQEDRTRAVCTYREGREIDYPSNTVGFRVAISSGWEKLD